MRRYSNCHYFNYNTGNIDSNKLGSFICKGSLQVLKCHKNHSNHSGQQQRTETVQWTKESSKQNIYAVNVRPGTAWGNMSRSCLDCFYLRLDVKFMDRYKLFKPIAMSSNVKPNQIQITFNIHVPGKTALDVYLRLTRRLMNFSAMALPISSPHPPSQGIWWHLTSCRSSAAGDGTLMTVKLKTKNYKSVLFKTISPLY